MPALITAHYARVAEGKMGVLPVYVFDSRDNQFCKWPRYWFLREITENAAKYKDWEIVVGNANDFIYSIGEHAIFKQSYGGSPVTIHFADFLDEIAVFVRQYDREKVVTTISQL